MGYVYLAYAVGLVLLGGYTIVVWRGVCRADSASRDEDAPHKTTD